MFPFSAVKLLCCLLVVCSSQKEAAEYLSTCTCPDYLAKAEKRLAEEAERVRLYLQCHTEAKITKVS